MTTFRRLILPVDGSAAADRGVAFAIELARREHAIVDVCSAVDEAAMMLPIAEGALISPAPIIEALEAASARYITSAVALLRNAGVEANGTALCGNPIAEIDRFSRERQADAIVIGTNGRGGVDRLFVGSVTTTLLRTADIPVITVHGDDTLRDGPLLVAIDASTASLAALDCAIDRARVTGTMLHLLHILEDRRIDKLRMSMGRQPQGSRRQALTDAEIALEDAADRVRSAGLPLRTEITRGDPAESIVTAAERHGAGSIAIGTHGRSAFECFFIGSVADAVVRHARVPVLVIHRRNATIAERHSAKRESATA